MCAEGILGTKSNYLQPFAHIAGLGYQIIIVVYAFATLTGVCLQR